MELLNHLTENSLVITPNQRLAAQLKRQLSAEEHRLANTISLPYILPFESWLADTFDALTLLLPETRLSSEQAACLWQQVVSTSPLGNSLLNTNATALDAQKAWGLMHHWQIPWETLNNTHHVNARCFLEWANAYQALCTEHHWVDAPQVIDRLIKHIEPADAHPHPHLILYQFIELTPQQTALVNHLTQCGITVEQISAPSCSTLNVSTEFETHTHEILGVACWAKEHYLANPQHNIACVFPNLKVNRALIMRHFKKVLGDVPFDISAGTPLLNQPLASTVKQLLALWQYPIDFDTISNLLRSPFIHGAETYQNDFSILDTLLRKTLSPQFSLKKLCSTIQYLLDDRHPGFAYFLSLLSQFSPPKGHLNPSEFAQHLLQYLDGLGWPGERSLNSTEHQVCQRVIEHINTLHQYDAIIGPQNTRQLSSLLMLQLQQSEFQPETPKAAIQVLGVLEAAGQRFDHLWLAECSDDQWPTTAKANPFLPFSLQVQHKIPHSNAEREMLFTLQMTEQCEHNAVRSIFSYSKTEGDSEKRQSPLIKKYEQHPFNALCEVSLDNYITPHLDYRCSHFTDDVGPPITSSETLKGGSDIITLQSHCPFKAFATHRLQTGSLETPQHGIPATTKGSLVHKALELIWLTLQNKKSLIQLSETALETLIKENIAKSIDFYHLQITTPKAFLEVEQQRLQSLLSDWLALEKTRSDFSIHAVEAKQVYTLGQLTLTLKIDRIDCDTEGNEYIIDYKTGAATISHWFGDHLKSPQLPLYCVSQTHNVQGIYFAQLKQNDLQLKGAGSEYPASHLKPLSALPASIATAPDWISQQQHWEAQLNQLACDFSSGQAAAYPMDVSTCQFCDLHNLCRVFEYE